MDGDDSKSPNIDLSQSASNSDQQGNLLHDGFSSLDATPEASDLTITSQELSLQSVVDDQQRYQKSFTYDLKQEIKHEEFVEQQPMSNEDSKDDIKMEDPEKLPVSQQTKAEESGEETDEEDGQMNTSVDGRCKVCGKTDEETKAEAAKDEDKQKQLYMSKKKSHLTIEPEFKWIACDHCRGWFHFSCAKLEQYEYHLYDTYYCADCAPTTGPSLQFKKHAPQRYRWFSPKEVNMPMEVGSQAWIERFRKIESEIPPPNEDEVCIVEDGVEFHEKFREFGGPQKWDKVFLVKNPTGLDMNMPPKSFDLENVLEIMGPDYQVDTIDVFSQTTYSMKLSTFLKKFRSEGERHLLYNFLSLEFSENIKMKQLAEPPQFVKDISLVNKLWPNPISDAYAELLATDRYIAEEIKPKVEQFCLAGMANSYTDFHVDFGGSSVYYHIFKGQKIFYIAPPTEENLQIYEQHEKSRETTDWFGDKIKGKVKRAVISEGQTLLIPAGWIHAVYTPVDSLVFGGNFLHLGNLEMQLRIYKLEMAVRKAINSAAKFYFPNFEFLHWMLVKNIIIPKLKKSDDEFSDMREVDNEIWKAIVVLADKLQEWLDRQMNETEGVTEIEETELLLSEKKSILKSVKRFIKTQNSRFGMEERLKNKKQSRRSRDTVDDDDDDYNPTSKKSAKKAKKEKNTDAPKKKTKADSFAEDLPFANASIVQSAPLKLKIVAGPTEDQSNVMQMFKNQCTSSGRHVKLNQSVVELGGTHLEARREEIPEKPTSTFQDLDKELIRCESIHAGEKPAKQRVPKVPKEPKEKKEKPPAKKKEDTTRSRLMKKLKM